MASPDGVSGILASISAEVAGHPSLPLRLCAACATAVATPDVVLTVMTRSGERRSTFPTTVLGERLAELQVILGDGPCADAFACGSPVLEANLDATSRWPMFAADAVHAGVRAVFAFPVQLGAIRLGVLTVYRHAPGMLGDFALGAALDHAEAAAMLILDLQSTAPAGTLHRQLEDAAYQPEVYQATGMIKIQLGVSIDVALMRLRAYAYAHEQRLGEVARDVVARRLRFDDPER